jgi:hypothetical protein
MDVAEKKVAVMFCKTAFDIDDFGNHALDGS